MRCDPCGSFDADAIRPLCDLEANPEEVVEALGEQEYGIRNLRKLLDPKMPSQKEVDEHRLTHLPYRKWCHYCVQGKGRVAPHFKQETRTDGLTENIFVYCFMATEGNPLATILVAQEKATEMSMPTVLPMKGGSIEFPARRVLAFLKEIGLEGADVVLKSDQGNAIRSLKSYRSEKIGGLKVGGRVSVQ